jgi:uncharacterized integral membrane protein
MGMIRKIGVGLLVLIIFLLMLLFTSINPGVIKIDLAFVEVEPSIPVAFAVTFVLGWLFGLACMSVFVVKLINERRRLRKSLRVAESEVSSLRSLPIADAD